MSVEPAVVRRLKDGWDYRPDWRLQVTETHLVEIATATDRIDALQAIMWCEQDPFIRQALRFRMSGRCVALDAFEWAFRSAHDNQKSGVLSMLKAMVIAGLPAKMIAVELATDPLNITVAERLFFDVRRHLANRLWLRNAVIQPHEGELTIEESREHHWLNVAFESGWRGLEVVLHGGEDASDESLESRAKKIEAIAGQRALEYLRGLQHRAVAANEEDVKRYLLARGMRSREAATTASEQSNRFKEWGLAVVRMLSATNMNDLDAKTVQDASRILPLTEIAELAAQQSQEQASVVHEPVATMAETAPSKPVATTTAAT